MKGSFVLIKECRFKLPGKRSDRLLTGREIAGAFVGAVSLFEEAHSVKWEVKEREIESKIIRKGKTRLVIFTELTAFPKEQYVFGWKRKTRVEIQISVVLKLLYSQIIMRTLMSSKSNSYRKKIYCDEGSFCTFFKQTLQSLQQTVKNNP